MNIQPIRLLRGSHPDTGQTGQGCFMNVIAYLNGEPQITDQSPCVCGTIRPIAIFVNDNMDDAERHKLLPYLLRAMGSATQDVPTLVARAQAAARLARRCAGAVSTAASAEWVWRVAEWAANAENAAAWAEKAANAANAASVEWADRAAEWAVSAAEWAGMAAEWAGMAIACSAAIPYCLEYLDEVCPPASEPTAQQIARAQELVALAQSQ